MSGVGAIGKGPVQPSLVFSPLPFVRVMTWQKASILVLNYKPTDLGLFHVAQIQALCHSCTKQAETNA